MALTPGTRLGPYEVLAQIGVGGMGEVYKATDTNLKRSVAIKVLPASVAGDAERLARFQREAEVLAALNHPNIAAIYGLERSGSTTALVMELVEGPTLADRIAHGAVPLDEALPIARQICEALETAHEQGIVHRDLKPANIKVRADGTVKVLDFGLAKAMEPTAGSSANASMSPTITTPAMTQAGVILGTAAYMSPEQARGKTVDKRADIWAFGAVLFEMLTSRRAFGGEDVAETLANVINKEPSWEALPTAVSAHVRQTLRLCLRKPPRERVPDIGAVRLALEGAFETVVAPLANDGGGRSRKATAILRAWQVVAGLLVLTTVTGAAAWWSVSRPVTPLVTRFFIYPPEKTTFVTAGRAGTSVAISPDGRRLAFTARDESGKVLLWVRPIDSLTPQPLPGTDDAAFPFWSPDSRSIAYFAQDKLLRIDATGGPPQTVCAAPVGRGGAWSRDGVIVFGSLFGVTPGALSRVPAVGGQPVLLTKLEGSQVDHRFPSFLPDGRHVLFYAQANSPESSGVYLTSLDSGASTRLLAANSGGIYVSPGYLLFTRDGTLLAQPFDTQRLEVMGAALPVAERVESLVFQGVLAFSASSNGTLVYGGGLGSSGGQQMTWFDRKGKPIEDVGPVAEYRGVDLSPDGTHVAVHRQDDNGGDIWVTDLARRTTSRFTFDASQENSSPTWSPDGTRIAYDSNKSGKPGIYAKRASGAGVEELLVDNVGRPTVWSWAADGRALVYEANGDLWTVGLTGDRKPALATHTPGINEAMAQVSPDGKWVAYQSNETTRGEVYVQPFPSGEGKWQVSTSGGGWPRWRRDSGELFYQQAMGNRMMAVEVTSRGATFEAGTPRDLFGTPYVNLPHTGGPYQAYAVSADGQRFLFPHPPSSNGSDLTMPIAVVENWAAGLRR